MPLLLLALPLSFQTFWRYLILLPFLAVFAFVMAFASLIPLVGLLVPGTISAFCLIVGLRCALAAQGHYSVPDPGRLLRFSLIFCILNIVATFLIGVLAASLYSGFALIMSALGYARDDPSALFSLQWAAGGALFLYLVLIAAYAAAIAVPMTASAAAAGTRHNSEPDPLFGFGKGMFSLVLIMLVWLFGGNFLAIFGEVQLIFILLMGALLAFVKGEEIPWEWSFDLSTLMGGTLFMAWASSWFFATAVLAWEKAGRRRAEARAAAVAVSRVSTGDLRALREARERGQRGPVG